MPEYKNRLPIDGTTELRRYMTLDALVHFWYFLHRLTASAANTSGFLQVSLSKIRCYIDVSRPVHGSPRISDER
jgi:hypothetical protein